MTFQSFEPNQPIFPSPDGVTSMICRLF
jgi:hypothetical protein